MTRKPSLKGSETRLRETRLRETRLRETRLTETRLTETRLRETSITERPDCRVQGCEGNNSIRVRCYLFLRTL